MLRKKVLLYLKSSQVDKVCNYLNSSLYMFPQHIAHSAMFQQILIENAQNYNRKLADWEENIFAVSWTIQATVIHRCVVRSTSDDYI